MEIYYYKAVARNGELLEGELEAASTDEVIDYLQNIGHIPLGVTKEIKRSKLLRFYLKKLFWKHRLSTQDIMFFTRQISTLLQAGVPLDQALSMLAKLSTQPALKNTINDIHQRIREGSTMAEAIEAQGSVFNKFYLHTVRAGESGGALHIVLDRLADYLERSAELRSNILSALLYPTILFTVAVVSIFILIGFVVPQFLPLFEDVGQALPLLTQIVFSGSTFVQHYYGLMLLLMILAIYLFTRWLGQMQNRLRWDKWCLQLPLYGQLIAKLDVARFTRTLGTLLTNGVPLLTAVMIVKEIIHNQILANIVKDASQSLEQGNGLASVLAESDQFPKLAVQLIQIGEETGKLESMLLKTADIYEQESNTTIKRLLILLEPVLILSLGGMIAIIITSILLAILGLNQLVI